MIINILKTNIKLDEYEKIIKNIMSDDVKKMFKDVLLESFYMKVLYNNFMKDNTKVDDIDRVFSIYIGKSRALKSKLLMLDAVYKEKQLMSFVENFNKIHDKHLDFINMKLVPPSVIVCQGIMPSKIITCQDDCTMMRSDGVFDNCLHVKFMINGQTFCIGNPVDYFYDDGIEYMDIFDSNNMEITRACHDHGYYRDKYLEQYPIIIDNLKRDINDFMHSDQL